MPAGVFMKGKHMRDNQPGQEKQYAGIILVTIFHYLFIVLEENNVKQASEN